MDVGCKTLPPHPGGPPGVLACLTGWLGVTAGAAEGMLNCDPNEDVCGTRGGRPAKEFVVKAKGVGELLLLLAGVKEIL